MEAFMFRVLVGVRIERIQDMIIEDGLEYVEWDEANPHRKEDETFAANVFFERDEYKRKMVGCRGPNYKRPFRNKYRQVPNGENKSSLYYDYFAKRLNVVGYSTPYSYYNPWINSLENEKRVTSDELLQELVKGFNLGDNNWVEINNDNAFEEATTLTRRLFKSDKKIGKVEEFGFLQKLRICKDLDLCSSPGLPFCQDPFTQFKADCLDRLFSLAEEIDVHAMVKDPKDVEVPPCTLIAKSNPETRHVECDFYPSALQILEKRFLITILTEFADPNRKNELPTDFKRGSENTKKMLESLTEGKKCGCVVKFTNLRTAGVHPKLVDFAFSLVKQWLYMKSVDHSAEENERVFEFLKYYFKLSPVLLPTGQLIETVCGGMLGSYFSLLVGDISATFAVVYSMLKQGVDIDTIEGNIHCVDNEVAFSVPATFSDNKLLEDLQSLGFKIPKKNIKLSNKSSDLSFNGYTVNGREFDIAAIMQSLYGL